MTSAQALGMVGNFLTRKANQMVVRKNTLEDAKANKHHSFLPKVSKFLCELAGWGCFIYTGFLVTSVAGFIIAGVAFLTFSWRIDIGGSE
jgi:hypothetical protein